LTGINIFLGELTAKRLELLRELVPAVTRVAVLVNPTNAANTETTLRELAAAAPAMGLQIQVFNASNSRQINAAFAIFVRDRPEALFVGNDPFLSSRRIQIVQLTAHHSIPATFALREFAEVGGLMSYGTNFLDTFRQLGVYAGRILKGAWRRPRYRGGTGGDLRFFHPSPFLTRRPRLPRKGWALPIG
jgi:ABC-type uncharacterized transport system substrate-binding protein